MKLIFFNLFLLTLVACHSTESVIKKEVILELFEVDSLSSLYKEAYHKIEQKEELLEVEIMNNTDNSIYIFTIDSIFFTVDRTSFMQCETSEGFTSIHCNFDSSLLEIKSKKQKRLLFRQRLWDNQDVFELDYSYYKTNECLNEDEVSAEVVYKIKNEKLLKKVEEGESWCD